MKKILLGLFSFILITNAHAASELDTKMQKAGIIDSNYKFKDINRATEFFKKQPKATQSSDYDHSQSYLNVISEEYTPFQHTLKLKFTNPVIDNMIPYMQEMYQQQNFINETCKATYLKDKYMAANNATMQYSIYNTDGTLIADLKLDKDTCSQAMGAK